MPTTSAHRILITRPTGQHQELVARCEALGLQVTHLPCLSIEPLCSASVKDALMQAAGVVLFTSANSVRSAHSMRPFPWPHVQAHAIGQSTAKSLAALNQTVSLIPDAPFNSEAYLAKITKQAAQPRLIIKGEGGRTLIYDELKRKAWPVQSIDVYRRQRTDVNSNTIDALFAQGIPELISITSDEVLMHFLAMTHSHQPALFNSQLIVNSRRCADKATESGFILQPLVAQPPGDDGHVICIRSWLETSMPTNPNMLDVDS